MGCLAKGEEREMKMVDIMGCPGCAYYGMPWGLPEYFSEAGLDAKGRRACSGIPDLAASMHLLWDMPGKE